MSFQKIVEKTNAFIHRINSIVNIPIFSPEVKNAKIKRLIFLFFILLCIIFVFGIYKIETISFAGFIITSILFVGIYLYYVFQPEIITKIIFYTLLLLVPVSIYLRLQEINQKESEFTENIITKIVPQFLTYQVYIIFMAYALFEILLRLISRYSQNLRTKIKENPFTIRFYFFLMLAFVNFLIEIF